MSSRPLPSYASTASDFLAFCRLEPLIFHGHNYIGHWREFAAVCLVYCLECDFFEHFPEYIEPFESLSPVGRLELASALIERVKEVQSVQAK